MLTRVAAYSSLELAKHALSSQHEAILSETNACTTRFIMHWWHLVRYLIKQFSTFLEFTNHKWADFSGKTNSHSNLLEETEKRPFVMYFPRVERRAKKVAATSVTEERLKIQNETAKFRLNSSSRRGDANEFRHSTSFHSMTCSHCSLKMSSEKYKISPKCNRIVSCSGCVTTSPLYENELVFFNSHSRFVFVK